MTTMTPVAFTSVRRRRFLLLIFVLSVTYLFLFRDSFSLPESLKDAGVPYLSRGNIVSLAKPRFGSGSVKVDEIYGLIHLVTGGDEEHQHVLTSTVNFDPTKPVDMGVYAAGEVDIDWSEEMRRLNERYPVVVFSKSFCPYSKRAKELLQTYDLQPPPKIIEVDLRDDATQIKALLTRLTQHSTFPNILIKGKSIGGSDNLQKLDQDKALKRTLEKAGVEVFGQEA